MLFFGLLNEAHFCNSYNKNHTSLESYSLKSRCNTFSVNVISSYLDTRAQWEGQCDNEEEPGEQGQDEGAQAGALGIGWKKRKGGICIFFSLPKYEQNYICDLQIQSSIMMTYNRMYFVIWVSFSIVHWKLHLGNVSPLSPLGEHFDLELFDMISTLSARSNSIRMHKLEMTPGFQLGGS